MASPTSDHTGTQASVLKKTTLMAGSQSSTHMSAVRLPQSSFSRSFSRPLPPNGATNLPRPPFASDTNRGSVTSVYSQASTAERPSSITAISINRKQPPRTLQNNHATGLTSVDEDEDPTTPKYKGLSTHDAMQKHRQLEQHPAVTPRPNSPEQEDKPLVSPITRTNSQWSRSAVSPEQSVRNTKIYRSDTITTLTKAISYGVHKSASHSVKKPAESHETLRMPFSGSAESTLTEEDLKSIKTRFNADPMTTIPLHDAKSLNEDTNNQRPSFTAARSMSTNSSNPLLESPIDQPTSAMSDRIPAHRRPPNLNLNMVKEAEARGSLTSLPDLIKRATRLASNLDRGKTASRLGLEAMFSSSDKSSIKKRESTYSDVLFSFPAPGVTTPTSTNHEQRSVAKNADVKDGNLAHSRLMEIKDVDDQDDEDAEDEKPRGRRRRKHSKRRRRCCGMPLSVFLVLLALFLVLVVAAVLLPIFLILLPRQLAAHDSPSGCSAALTCHNGGISIIDNNACACICVDGFTGSQCTTAADPSCVTSQIRDSGATYDNATFGSSILNLLSRASSDYNIPLNVTALLSVFAHNNLSCSAENSFVRFNVDPISSKRFVMIPGLEPQPLSILPLPTRIIRDDPTKRSPQSASAETENNIIYAATSSSATPTPTGIETATPTGPSGTATPSATAKAEPRQIEFAQIVVLYVLQQFRSPSLAVSSQAGLDRYLKTGGPAAGNSTVVVVASDTSGMTANFVNLTITTTDGNVVGGSRVTV